MLKPAVLPRQNLDSDQNQSSDVSTVFEIIDNRELVQSKEVQVVKDSTSSPLTEIRLSSNLKMHGYVPLLESDAESNTPYLIKELWYIQKGDKLYSFRISSSEGAATTSKHCDEDMLLQFTALHRSAHFKPLRDTIDYFINSHQRGFCPSKSKQNLLQAERYL